MIEGILVGFALIVALFSILVANAAYGQVMKIQKAFGELLLLTTKLMQQLETKLDKKGLEELVKMQ